MKTNHRKTEVVIGVIMTLMVAGAANAQQPEVWHVTFRGAGCTAFNTADCLCQPSGARFPNGSGLFDFCPGIDTHTVASDPYQILGPGFFVIQAKATLSNPAREPRAAECDLWVFGEDGAKYRLLDTLDTTIPQAPPTGFPRPANTATTTAICLTREAGLRFGLACSYDASEVQLTITKYVTGHRRRGAPPNSDFMFDDCLTQIRSGGG
jgi:hypothetical protein